MKATQATPQVWTVELVKTQRPKVKVKVRPEKPHKEQIVEGEVRSDPEGFAMISIKWYGVTVNFQAAWQTVANCLNNNRAILY
jgi:hypothetical protein